ACSMLISYERARAESLGLDARGGLMERAERFVLLSVAFAFNIVVPILWIMLVLTAATAVQRFVRVYRQAAHPPRVHTRRARRGIGGSTGGFRVVRALLGRDAPPARRRPRGADLVARKDRRLRAHRQRPGAGQRRDPRVAAPRRLGVGGRGDGPPRVRPPGGRRARRAARAARVVRGTARGLRPRGRRARSRRVEHRPSVAARQPRRLSAV